MTSANRSCALLICLVLPLLLLACNVSTPPPATATPTPTPPPTATATSPPQLTLATGNPELDWYVLSQLVGTTLVQQSSLDVSLEDNSSMMESLKLLLGQQVDLAFVYDHHLVLANQGNLSKSFPDAPSETLHIKCGAELVRPYFPEYGEPARLVIPLNEQPLHLITTAAGGISTAADLRGKRVGVGLPGSITAELAGYVLTALNIDPATELTLQPLRLSEAVAALDAGTLDAFFWDGQVPNPVITDLFATATVDPVLVSLAGDEATRIMQAHPDIFHRSTIAAQTYPNQPTDVDTLAVTLVLAAMEALPAEQVTDIVTLLINDPQVAVALSMPPDTDLSQLNATAGTYVHAGAQAYFGPAGTSE